MQRQIKSPIKLKMDLLVMRVN